MAMDDFFSSPTEKKVEEKKQEEEKVEINVDESLLLTEVMKGCLEKNQLHDALLILRE